MSGFGSDSVVKIVVHLTGYGAIDELRFCRSSRVSTAEEVELSRERRAPARLCSVALFLVGRGRGRRGRGRRGAGLEPGVPG
jgi:hypothetical protein